MPTPRAKRRAPSARNFWATLQNDPIAGLTLGVFAATAGLYFFPLLPAEHVAFLSLRLGPFFFLTLAVAALRFQLERIKVIEDREFWNDLLNAFLCWWVASAMILIFPSAETRPFTIQIITSVLYALYYIALLMAIERQPHRRHRWRPLSLERWLSWLTVTTVVFGLFLYFPFLAIWTDTEAYESGVPDVCLYLALDGYLFLRLLYLFRVTESSRWRLLYALLAGAMAAVLLNDIAEALALITDGRLWRWDALANVLLYLPYLLIVAAARLRHHPFPWEPPPTATKIRLEENLPGPLGQTMTFLLLFPLVHFITHELGILAATSQPSREMLVLIWLPILGTIAVVQYRFLEKALLELKEERQGSERALHKTQKELRLVQERQQTDAALRASHEKFKKAFRSCPDVMTLSRLEDGLILEVNESCERVFGYSPEELVGHTSEELGLWTEGGARVLGIEELRREGRLMKEAAFRKKSGEERIAVFSARLVEIEGKKHLFSVTRDVTEKRNRLKALRQEVAALEKALSPIWVVNDDGQVIYRNEATTASFERSFEDVVRKSEGSLRIPVAAGSSSRWVILRSAGLEKGSTERRSGISTGSCVESSGVASR